MTFDILTSFVPMDHVRLRLGCLPGLVTTAAAAKVSWVVIAAEVCKILL